MAIQDQLVVVGDLEDPYFVFDNHDIVSVEGLMSCAIGGENLAIDTLAIEVNAEAADLMIFKPKKQGNTEYFGIETASEEILAGHFNNNGTISDLEYGTPVYYYIGEDPICEFYIDTVERVQKSIYKLNCMSLMGIFDKQSSYGGVYFGETFENVVKEILYSKLKSPYDDAEYVSCDGTQYLVDLSGKKYKSFTPYTEVVFELKFNTITSEECLFGSEWMSCCIDASYIYISGYDFDSKTLAYTFNSSDVYLLDFKFLMGDSTEQCSLDITNKTTSQVTHFTFRQNAYSYNNRSMYFFAFNSIDLYGQQIDGEATKFFSGNIYSLKVSYYQTGFEEEYNDLKPVVNNFSNSGELYDSIKDYYNASVSNFPFSPGPKIQNEDSDDEEEIEIEYGNGIADIPIYGYLPATSKRANLYQLLTATNVNMIRKSDGGLLFDWLSNETSDVIVDNDIYDDGKVTYRNTLNSAKVTEHSYLPLTQDNPTTLYDNTESIYPIVGDSFVSFSSAPIILSTIQTTDSLMIREINENCAVVYGRGKLLGIPYTHTTNVVSKSNPSALLNSVDSEISDVTLISAANSQNVLERLYAYKSKKQEITGSFVFNGEKCGKCYSFKNAYSESIMAFINKLTLYISGKIKADFEAVKDYVPVSGGNNFKNYTILTGSGYWYVPDGVNRIRVIMIGGADGGDSGFDGETPDAGTINGGHGGAAGEGGLSGKILIIDIDELESRYHYSCGAGGEGGKRKSDSENESGKSGTATTFGDYSTYYDGARSPNGIVNMFTGIIYGLPGKNGIDGGDGAHYSDEAERLGRCNGEDVYDYPYTYHGGKGEHDHWSDGAETIYGGGGAAVGNDGENGSNPSHQYIGGNGADAIAIVEESLYGCGGHGGHGGGGGGAAKKYFEGETEYPGTGGKGTDGTKGGDGCILIYY